MRDYGKVHTSFWSSATIRALSEDGRMLALYLMTSPHTTITGTFRLPDGYVSEDLSWSPERVREGFKELLSNGFANRCETSKWVWITKHLEWNPPENPNQRKAAAKCASGVPDECAWKLDFLRVHGDSLGLEIPKPVANRSRTLSKPLRNQKQKQEQEQEQEQDQEQKHEQDACATPRAPRSGTPRAKSASALTWDAYAEAYAQRYHVAPTRNAKVNGQLANFVERVPAEEAPAIAAWFVSHQRRWYVERCHSVDCLLRDSETLRTEYATGRRGTTAQAIQADRTQTNLNAFAPLLAEARAKEAEDGHIETA